jgi:hypothetical protein
MQCARMRQSVLGIVVSVTTDVPLAPEVGLVLGALVGWLIRHDRA